MNNNEETELNRRQRFGKWMSRNAEEVAFYGTYTVLTLVPVGVFAWAVVAANKEAKEVNEHLMVDGDEHYWIIEDGTTSLI